MREKTTQVNFRVGPRLRELIFALSETSGQSIGKVLEQAIFHEALARSMADVRSGALKPSEARIGIENVRHDFGRCLERLTENLLRAYSHRLTGFVEATEEAAIPIGGAGRQVPPSTARDASVAETERDAEPASRDRVARIP